MPPPGSYVQIRAVQTMGNGLHVLHMSWSHLSVTYRFSAQVTATCANWSTTTLYLPPSTP